MRFRHHLLLFLFLSSLRIGAQEKEVDSIYSAIKKGLPDTSLANAYVAITELIGYTYPDTVIPLSRKAIEVTEKHKGQLSKAEKHSFRKSKANALNNIGLIYMNQGDISQALDNFHSCLKLMEDNNDKAGVTLALNNIGGIYRSQGDNIQALDYYLRALKIARASGDKDGTAFSLGNIGVIYGNQGYTDKAIECYKKSLKIRKEIGDRQGSAMSLNNIGFMLEKKSSHGEALAYYIESLEAWKEIDDKDGMAYTLVNMGNVYFNTGNYQKAKEYAEKSFKLSNEINFPEDIRDAAYLLTKIYRKQNNWKAALDMQDLYISMRDSISNEETKKTAVKKQLQYQYEKEKLELEKEQEKKDLLRKEEKERQRVITYSVAGLLFLVLVFSSFLYNRFRVIRKQKGIIEEQKHMVEEKQKEIIDSIHYAQRIQSTLLAHKDLLDNNLRDYFVLFKPKDIVSGDFYWATEKNESFYLAVCDSTGHGVPGAFMSLLNVSFLNEAITEKNISACNEIFNYVRKRLITSVSQEGGQDGMDGIILSVEKNENGFVRLSYAAAYNTPVLLRGGKLTLLPADKMPVGKGERKNDFNLNNIPAQKGDVLYLFTDGFADQFGGPKGKKFKYKKLYEQFSAIHQLDMEKQRELLEDTFTMWKGDLEQVDDVCIIGIRI
jgi:tetratricopeptide (TPR) repeat protein